MATALIIGSSSGVGLELARRLVDRGWTVIGLARRGSPLGHASYQHVVADVRAASFRDVLVGAVGDRALDACIYTAGIGEPIDLANLALDGEVFATNLLGLVTTCDVVLPRMLAAGSGHILGLSSQADRVIDDFAPSYSASKAAMSSYLEGLALICRRRGVSITNIRFGFIDTAMSRHAKLRPFMMTADRAARLVERCMRRRPIRFTAPLLLAALLWLYLLPRRLRLRLA